MNRTLIDPFVLAQEYPERLTHKLELGNACCVVFSPTGDYLAVGLVDGNVLVVDTDTWTVLREFDGHVAPIQSFTWSQDSRYLLSSSRDWSCILWDMGSTGKYASRINAGAPVWQASMHPDNVNIFVASRYESPPVWIDLSSGTVKELPVEGKSLMTIFSPDGKYILSGNSKGDLVVFNESLELIHTEKIAKGNIKYIWIPAAGGTLVVNSTDRTIRVIGLPDFNAPVPEWSFPVINKFIDNITRQQYSAVTTSPSGEYLLAVAADNLHNIYMWESTTGTLVRIYESTEEELLVIAFHPSQACLIATGMDTGAIFVWTLDPPQQWSSLAPDFFELQENEPYYEREDEFDINDDHLDAAIVPVPGDVDVYTLENPPTHFIIPFDLDEIKTK